MTQDEAKRFARDRALSFDESHPMTLYVILLGERASSDDSG